MKKVFAYTVLRHAKLEDLIREVNEMTDQLWEPVGGMVTGNLEGTDKQFFQTMVIYESTAKEFMR